MKTKILSSSIIFFLIIISAWVEVFSQKHEILVSAGIEDAYINEGYSGNLHFAYSLNESFSIGAEFRSYPAINDFQETVYYNSVDISYSWESFSPAIIAFTRVGVGITDFDRIGNGTSILLPAAGFKFLLGENIFMKIEGVIRIVNIEKSKFNFDPMGGSGDIFGPLHPGFELGIGYNF